MHHAVRCRVCRQLIAAEFDALQRVQGAATKMLLLQQQVLLGSIGASATLKQFARQVARDLEVRHAGWGLPCLPAAGSAMHVGGGGGRAACLPTPACLPPSRSQPSIYV